MVPEEAASNSQRCQRAQLGIFRSGLSHSIIKSKLLDLVRAPKKQSADGREEQADDQEGGLASQPSLRRSLEAKPCLTKTVLGVSMATMRC
jgi:hypothetical protein